MRRNAKIAPKMAAQIRAALGLLNEELRRDERFAGTAGAAEVSASLLAAYERNDDSPECRAIRAGRGDDLWPEIAARQCHRILEWFLNDGVDAGSRVRPAPPETPRGYDRLVDLLNAPSFAKLDFTPPDRPLRLPWYGGRSILAWVWSTPPMGLDDNPPTLAALDALRRAGRLPKDGCPLLTELDTRGSRKIAVEKENKRRKAREEEKRAAARRSREAQLEAALAELLEQEQRQAEKDAYNRKVRESFRNPRGEHPR